MDEKLKDDSRFRSEQTKKAAAEIGSGCRCKLLDKALDLAFNNPYETVIKGVTWPRDIAPAKERLLTLASNELQRERVNNIDVIDEFLADRCDVQETSCGG